MHRRWHHPDLVANQFLGAISLGILEAEKNISLFDVVF